MLYQSCWNNLVTGRSDSPFKLVTIRQQIGTNLEQAVRTHLVNNLWTDLLQLVCRSVASCAFLRVYIPCIEKRHFVSQMDAQGSSFTLLLFDLKLVTFEGVVRCCRIINCYSTTEHFISFHVLILRKPDKMNIFMLTRSCVKLIQYNRFSANLTFKGLLFIHAGECETPIE